MVADRLRSEMGNSPSALVPLYYRHCLLLKQVSTQINCHSPPLTLAFLRSRFEIGP